jgi:LPXTG-site transpeptidase (sortase) family protein
MEVLFRRAALVCWTAILLLVVVVSVYGVAPAHRVATRAAIVDGGNDLAMEQAAAIKSADMPADTSLSGPSGRYGPPPPGRLIIRSIGVNAQVIGVTVDKQGNMGVTSTSYDVGWYRPGVVPGEPGDAVIDGHLDWYDTSRAVFYNLANVHVGDDIEVQRLDGVTKHFKVTGVRTVPYNAQVPGLFANTGASRLSLITCGGTWNQKLGEYLKRVIVDANLSS